MKEEEYTYDLIKLKLWDSYWNPFEVYVPDNMVLIDLQGIDLPDKPNHVTDNLNQHGK